MEFCFRYLGSGCTFTDLHYTFRLGVSTISNTVREVCHAIWGNLRAECFLLLTKEKWENIALDFERRTNFPHCLGAVDGKHVEIINPLGSMYFNYKGYSSIVLMAVADSSYRFVYVDVGGYGKDNDSTAFKRTSLWQGIESNRIELPPAKNLPGTNIISPYVLIGDEAFALHQHLLRPYGGSNLTVKKRVFNYRLCRARRYVEYAFGILSNKWRIFHRPINLEPHFAILLTQACVVLHNFVRDRDGYKFEDTLSITGLADNEPGEDRSMTRGGAIHIRDKVADYFVSNAGAVSWQLSKI